MPYTGPNDDTLPDNVKAMPDDTRAVWVKTFNGVHSTCMDQGGDDCEGRAMKMANGAAKRHKAALIEAVQDDTEITELGHLGNLLKWHLEKNKLTRGDLAAAMGYADASSVGRLLNGDITDASEEKLKKAAALFDIQVDELLAAQHRDLVKSGRRQDEMSTFLFADLANLTPGRPFDALLAGTFQDMYGQEVKITAADLEEIVANTKKLIATTATDNGEPLGLPIDAKSHDKGDAAGWILDLQVVDGVLQITPKWTPLGVDKIVNGIQRLFSATLDLARKVLLGGTLTNWPAVKGLRAIELSEHPGVYSLQAEVDIETQPSRPAAVIDNQNNGGFLHMDITKEELVELIGHTVAQATAPEPAPAPQKAYDPVAFLELQGASDDVVGAFKAQMLAQYDEMKRRAAQEASLMIAGIKREATIVEFAQKVTGGDATHSRGVAVAPDALKDALLKLPQGQEGFWMELLTGVQENGLAEFAEVGHGKIVKGTKSMPREMGKLLKQWLAAGQPVEEFFELNELGDVEAYDLSSYATKGGNN